MTDINEIKLEIKAVKFALRSFAKYENDGDRRRNFLRENFDTEPALETYYGFSEEKLQDSLNKLQEKENLLLAQQLGRNLFCYCVNLLHPKLILLLRAPTVAPVSTGALILFHDCSLNS